MGRHRNRHKERLVREIELEQDKFVITKDGIGIYSIMNITSYAKVIVLRIIKENDDEAFKYATKVLNLLQEKENENINPS